ncbi:MAG: hypothetical protein ACRDBP_15805 [Luteolibacter sp.]
MRFSIFLSGVTILAMGGISLGVLAKPDAVGFLTGAMQLGGGIVICGLFSLKMQWHGVIGAGVLALLGAARGLANVPGLAKFVAGDRTQGTTPVLEFGVTVICLLLFGKIIRALFQERVRRMLERGE